MIYEGDEYQVDDLDIFVWKTKMKSKVFKDYFESVVEARVFDGRIRLGKKGKDWKWLAK